MVEAQLALDNLREARTIELGLLSERREELLDRAAGLECTTFALQYILDGDGGYANYKAPRPSHDILHHTFADARTFVRRGESPSPALAFASEILIPMSGIVTAGEAVEGKVIEHFRTDGAREVEHFVESLEQVITGKYTGHDVITVHHDAQGRALALQKSRYAGSALLLKPVIVEGIKIPAAISVGLSICFDSHMITGRVELDNNGALVSYLVEGPLEIDQTQVTPWAYRDELDRCSFAMQGAGDNFDYDARRAEMFERYSFEDFQRAAETILEMCEVENLPTATQGEAPTVS